MSKAKPYAKVNSEKNRNNLNKLFIPKESQKMKYSQPKRIMDYMGSPIYSANGDIEDSKIVITRSKISKSYTYSDNISELATDELYMRRNKESIRSMYNVLKRQDNEIICKPEAFRRMKELSFASGSILACSANSKMISINGMKLQPHIKAYLYSMVYPPVFEICAGNEFNTIYDNYLNSVNMWVTMLEDALIIDGAMEAIHNFFTKNLLLKDENILCSLKKNGSKITAEYNIDELFKFKETDTIKSKDYIKNLKEAYHTTITLSCLVDEKRIEGRKSSKKSDHFRSVSNLIDYPFFQAGTKGRAMYKCILKSINKCMRSYKDLQKRFDNKVHKVFPLYLLNRQSRIFDFYWHYEFDNVKFHLTQGFMTNYVLYKVMRQINELWNASIPATNSVKSPEVEYAHVSSSECAIQYSIESYDLYFLNSLIRRISDTLTAYDIYSEKNAAHKLYSALQNMVSYIADDFISFLDNEFQDRSFASVLRERFGASKDYYKLIYEDIYEGFQIAAKDV